MPLYYHKSKNCPNSSFYFINRLRIQVITETTNDPINAGINPAMVNPGTTTDASQKKNAFSMIPNIPSVIMLIGSVISFKIGLREILMRPSTSATNNAVRNVGTPIPGTRYEAASTAPVSTIQRKSIFNIQIIY